MTYQTEPKYRKLVKGYDFLLFARRFGAKIWSKFDGYCTKNRNRCCKNCRSKTAEATGDLIGNKMADKISSVDKTKSKAKEDETKISTYHQKKNMANYLSLKIVLTPYKNEIPKNYKPSTYDI